MKILEERLLKGTKLKFQDKLFISSGKIQYIMHLPYATSALILNRLINEGYASKPLDTRSVVLTGKNKTLKYLLGLSYCKMQWKIFSIKKTFKDIAFHIHGVQTDLKYRTTKSSKRAKV